MMFWGLYLDPLYVVLFIVTLVISGGAQLYIRSTFAKWNAIANSAGLTGAQVGEQLVTRASFGGASGPATGISFKVVPGDLSDHFDPRTRQVGLSSEVASRNSVAAMAVTAHEVGHAQQHAEGTVAMRARAFLVPAVTFSPMLSYLLIFLGLIFNLTGLFWLGIVFFALMVVFSVLTLPVESRGQPSCAGHAARVGDARAAPGRGGRQAGPDGRRHDLRGRRCDVHPHAALLHLAGTTLTGQGAPSEGSPDGDPVAEPAVDDEAPRSRPRQGWRRWLSPASLGTLLLVAIMVGAGIFAAVMVTPGPDEEALPRPSNADVVIAAAAPLSWIPRPSPTPSRRSCSRRSSRASPCWTPAAPCAPPWPSHGLSRRRVGGSSSRSGRA